MTRKKAFNINLQLHDSTEAWERRGMSPSSNWSHISSLHVEAARKGRWNGLKH
jgi:hypothetical protein